MTARTDIAPELVVLLDEAGRATGTADKATVHSASTPLHLAFSAYLFDDANRLLVTRRALTKRTFPGVWTNSVCGHPAPGESLTEAIRRRATQELGLHNSDLGDLRLVLPTFGYRAEMDGVVENELCPVYAGRIAYGTVTPDPTEVDQVAWVDWQTFSREAQDGDREVSQWCREQVQELRALGDDPHTWPAADPAKLPPAASL